MRDGHRAEWLWRYPELDFDNMPSYRFRLVRERDGEGCE
jgi:hypothetical protein